MFNTGLVSVPATATPLVQSLLTGPEAFRAAVENNPTALDRAENVDPLEMATRLFANGIFNGDRLVARPVIETQSGLRRTDARGSQASWAAARDFADALARLYSGHYAMGRAGLDRAVVRGKEGVLALRPSAVSEREYYPMGITSQRYRQRAGIGSEQEMIDYLRFGDFERIKDEAVAKRLYQFLGVETFARAMQEILADLAAIWNSATASTEDRELALRLWFEGLDGWRRDNPIGPADFLDDLWLEWPRLENLFSLFLNEGDETIRNGSAQVLGRFLGVEKFNAALRFLPKIVEVFQKDPSSLNEKGMRNLLGIYGGILAMHGVQETEAGKAMVVEGALALLDIAGDARLPMNIRYLAFKYAFYAVEKFVPTLYTAERGLPIPSVGAKMVYDWVNWRVEVEEDPAMAFAFALGYATVFTAACYMDREPAYGQQWVVVLNALKRPDLNVEQRDDLWEKIIYNNQKWWLSAAFRLMRRFGYGADPRPQAPAPQAA